MQYKFCLRPQGIRASVEKLALLLHIKRIKQKYKSDEQTEWEEIFNQCFCHDIKCQTAHDLRSGTLSYSKS